VLATNKIKETSINCPLLIPGAHLLNKFTPILFNFNF